MRVRALARFCVSSAVVLAAAPAAAVDVECPWRWVNPMPPRTTLFGAADGPGGFMAVGADGLILMSSDGERWQRRDPGVSADLYGVHFASQHWVAVGEGMLLTSRYGDAWSVAFSDPAVTLNDVDFGASRFVAVGSGMGGDVLLSSNGTAWSRVATALPDDVQSVVWAGDVFFACSGDEVYRSADGESWSFVAAVPAGAKDHLFELERYDLAWTGSRLVWSGGPEAWVSPDGERWTLAATVDGCEPFSRFVGALGTPSGAVLSGFGACPSTLLVPEAQLYTSTDGGSTWTMTWRDFAGGFPALARVPGTIVALGDGGDLLTSANGIDWVEPGSGCTSEACADGFADLTATEDGMLAAGGVGLCDEGKRLGGGTVAETHGGSPWSVAAVDIDRMRGVAFGGAGLAAVGDAWAASSADGHEWEVHDVPTVWPLNSVAWGNGTFVAVGDEGALLTSSDGSLWFDQWSTTSADLERVAWDGDRFVAVGEDGTILASTDTTNWYLDLTSSEAHLYGVAAGDEVAVAVGSGGTILATNDRHYWFAPITGATAELRGVAYNGRHFAAVGFSPGLGPGSGAAVVLVSPDGAHWTSFPIDAPALLSVAGHGGTGFIAVGENRALLEASCVGTLAALDPQLRAARVGVPTELVLRLEQVFEVDVDVELVSSNPAVASVPAEVTLPRGSAGVAVPVEARAIGRAWVTATLPNGLGAGSTAALVEVGPSTVTPRRPGGRLVP
ncbi:MAG: hypothetical protein C3F15_13180 [Holophagae bacterium]|nr:MAG: hypothetical protein C3F15_13180 [Holophagae bacterium]